MKFVLLTSPLYSLQEPINIDPLSGIFLHGCFIFLRGAGDESHQNTTFTVLKHLPELSAEPSDAGYTPSWRIALPHVLVTRALPGLAPLTSCEVCDWGLVLSPARSHGYNFTREAW